MASINTCQRCPRTLGPPHARSSPITIPYDLKPQFPIPHILRNGDTTPGIVHVRTGPIPNITEYITIHSSKMLKPSEAQFQNTNPRRLGVTVPPGFGPKPPPRKDVKIVPDHLPAKENLRKRNQWAWKQEQMLKERRAKKVAQTSNERMRILEVRRKMEAAQIAREREQNLVERRTREATQKKRVAAKKVAVEGAAEGGENAGCRAERMSGLSMDVAICVV